MANKRALIVDDSRSARAILSRMLETHDLQVDTVESGEQALEYLRNARPDVVFMDHLMPGMDGFETTRAMKANAQTASIPVMMYTSQEGDAYLREARKAGAVGVLAKTLKPTDVSHALYALNLLPERREDRATLVRHAGGENVVQLAASSSSSRSVTSSFNASSTAISSASDAREQLELQKMLQAKFEEFSARSTAEFRLALGQMHASATTQASAKPTNGFFAVALMIVAIIPTAVLGTLYWRAINDSKAQLEQSAARLAMVVTDQQTQIEQLRVELRKQRDEAFKSDAQIASVTNVPTQTIAVPYAELPLAGARVESLRVLLDRLNGENFQGKISIATYIGDFCLSGGATVGYHPARDTLQSRRCDLIGNPFADALTAAQRQSTEFANLLATTKIPVEIIAASRKPVVPYPAQGEAITAGDWNRIAVQNNRVEISAVPSDSP